jgi:hypothetical protein
VRAHLEKQFTPEMSWGNFGAYWEVDHIIPCWKFDLTILDQCRRCFALANLRPLEKRKNCGRHWGGEGDLRNQRIGKLK